MHTVLELECEKYRLLLTNYIQPSLLPNNQKRKLTALGFRDTWTKTRSFELAAYDTCVFLAADITIYRNMDNIL